MATYGNSIYQYADPTQVDISMLGKAVQFKQQNYDANTMNVQNLVNQYLNMDLARDVDKNYLGERLQTLVNYVNGSGQKDWSRANVARDVSNYIGGAIDNNVTKAVASTRMYRKQQEEIQALKAKNPELYNNANEWMATQDWERYVTSGQLGDMYRPQTYTNYVDVNKRVMEMAPKLLKDFAVQVTYSTEPGSTMMFRRVGKHEIITGEEAKKFASMVLGDDGRAQLAINSQYKSQSLTDDEVSENYNKYLGSKVDFLNNQRSEMLSRKGGATEADKAVITKNVSNMDDMISQIKSLGVGKTNRRTMLYNMEVDKFENGWGDLLSYDKIVSVDIDDSGYKTAKFNHEMQQDAIDNEFKQQDLNFKYMDSDRKYNLDLAKAMGDGTVTVDANGKPIANVGGISQQGINVTDNPTEEGDKTMFTADNIRSEYSGAYNKALKSLETDLSDPTKRKALEKEFGSLVGLSAKDILANFIAGEKGDVSIAQAKLANAQRKGLLSDSTVNALRSSQEKFVPWKQLNDGLDATRQQLKVIGNKIVDENKGGEMYAMSDAYIDANGKLQKGSFLLNKSTNRNKFNNYQQIGVELNTVLMALRDGNLDDATKSQYNLLADKLISELPKQHRAEAKEYYQHSGGGLKALWEHSKSSIGEIFYSAKGAVNKFFGDDYQANLDEKEVKRHQGIMRRAERDDVFFKDIFNNNFDLDDSGIDKKLNLKVDGQRTTVLNYMERNVKPISDKLNIEIQNYKPTTLTNKTVNVDTSLKGNKDIASFAMAVMPDMQVVPDSNVSINIGTDGNANVTAMVKDGKDIVSRTESVPISSIPQRLLQNIDMNQRNSMYDADGGKMGYSWKSEILPTRKKVLEEYGDAISDPASEGIMSKEEILDSAEKVYGKKFVDEHRKVIEKEMERDITMQAKVVNGAYVMDISNGITTERRQLNTTNLGTQIDLITMQKDKMSSEFVIQNILKTLNKLK